MVKSIKFPVRWHEPSDGWVGLREREGVAYFTLGTGPCGKDVTELSAEFTDNALMLHIHQTHSDGTTKSFHYFNRDIRGRVEIEYA